MKKFPDGYIDLIYADIPYNTGKIIRSTEPSKVNFKFETSYTDKFTEEEYEALICGFLKEANRTTKRNGTIYVHLDIRSLFKVKEWADKHLETHKFVTMITWKRNNSYPSLTKTWNNTSDHIFHYGNPHINTEAVALPITEEYHKRFRNRDGNGLYKLESLVQGREGGHQYEHRGFNRMWRHTKEKMKELEAQGMIEHPEGAMPRIKHYYKDPKQHPGNNWSDISNLNGPSKERTGYPTQKPTALLERIIKASSNEGDTVLDPFCGSGTTLAVAKTLNRNYIGIDTNPDAIQIAEQRLKKTYAQPSLYSSG